MAAAQPFGWVLTFEQAPVKVLALFANADLAQWQLLVILNFIMLFLGLFMEGLVVMVMAVPILMPLLMHLGIDPVHFGVILVMNVMIGAITPPVGTIMYVVCLVSKTPVLEFAREVWPLVIALIIAMFTATFIPELVMWLPNLLMPAR